MPKLKSRKSLTKRFKITKTGKVLRRGSYGRHLKAGKSKRRCRRQNLPHQVTGRIAIKLKQVMGY